MIRNIENPECLGRRELPEDLFEIREFWNKNFPEEADFVLRRLCSIAKKVNEETFSKVEEVLREYARNYTKAEKLKLFSSYLETWVEELREEEKIARLLVMLTRLPQILGVPSPDTSYKGYDDHYGDYILYLLSFSGKGVQEVIREEVSKIVDRQLDGLITDKDSWNSVVLYVRHEDELPRPDESNIKSYKEVARDHLKRKYGIRKDFGLPQMMMFLELGKRDRERVAEIIRKNKERNPRVYSLDKGKGFPKVVIRAVESKNPLAYNGRVLEDHYTYLPRSRRVLDYCESPGRVLVRYDVNGETLGSAVCYFDRKSKTFLVESVEGNGRLRNEGIFEIVYNDLIERGKMRGAQKIVFKDWGRSKTSEEFVRYLENKRLMKEEVKMLICDAHRAEGYIV